MLRHDTEYVLTWNAAAHTWEARPIKRDGRHIVRVGPDRTKVGVASLLTRRHRMGWDD